MTVFLIIKEHTVFLSTSRLAWTAGPMTGAWKTCETLDRIYVLEDICAKWRWSLIPWNHAAPYICLSHHTGLSSKTWRLRLKTILIISTISQSTVPMKVGKGNFPLGRISSNKQYSGHHGVAVSKPIKVELSRMTILYFWGLRTSEGQAHCWKWKMLHWFWLL